VEVGKAVALISTEAVAAAPAAPQTPAATTTVTNTAPAVSATSSAPAAELVKNGESGRFYSPLVRNIAKEEGISMAELESISGSGVHGRVTKNDILGYLPNKGKLAATNGEVTATATVPNNGGVVFNTTETKTEKAPAPAAKSAVALMPGDEIVEMDRMRKLIADHMVMSVQTSPHVTSYVEADVTNLVQWRDRIKKDFEKREGEKITFTPVFIEAVVRAIKDFPMVNVSVDGQKIIVRKNINIGMAAALPSGNLIVPVIKNADRMNLIGLTKTVNDLANRARGNKLQPDEIQGGTFTITNVGSFGNVMGTPIINQPQVAILAVGAIRKRPAVLETPQGDVIAIRHMMFLSLSYDHRVVDGMLGGSFLRRIGDYLEQFDPNREL
jgi:2-oxoglutarate dehydrogenase E2 component (dihydrolipoamide succinyltransferase)